MKQPHRSTLLPFLMLIGLLLMVGLGCKTISAGQRPFSGGANSTQAGPLTTAEMRGPGKFDLARPASGLDDLDSYTQSLTTTINASLQGEPYTAKTSILRTRSGETVLSELESHTNADVPIYIAMLRTPQVMYVQQVRQQSCRASQDVQRPDAIRDPVLSLPPVFGAQEEVRETLDGQAAIRYSFDERAVRYAAGQNGTARGLLWVTQDSGLLLKYSLTIESKGGETPGTQSWEYSLSAINAAQVPGLPAGCVALPLDVPILPGAQALVFEPGFARYTSPEALAATAQFYREQMPAAGWQALPGDEAADGPLTLSFTMPQEEGSQLSLVRMQAVDGAVQVVIQVSAIRNRVQSDPNSPDLSTTPPADDGTGAGGGAGGGSTLAPPASDLPGALPPELSIYPGSSDVIQTEYLLMLTAPATLREAASYYQQELFRLGWNMDENNEMTNVLSQEWSKAGSTIYLVITNQDNITQVIFTNGD